MSTLPELTDEQIDTAWKRANTTTLTEHGPVLNRGLPSWRELRAAFPKPKPPAPEAWSHDQTEACVEVALDEGRVWVAVTRVWHTEIDLAASEARDMAGALVECADWIEANR